MYELSVLQPFYTEITFQVKKEEISLPLQANPLIKGNQTYNVFDAAGETHAFTPSFHVS